MLLALMALFIMACGGSPETAVGTSDAPNADIDGNFYHQGIAEGSVSWTADVAISHDSICVELGIERTQTPISIRTVRAANPACSEAPLDTDIASAQFEPIFLVYVAPSRSDGVFVAAGVASREITSLDAITTDNRSIDVELFESGFFFLASTDDVEGVNMTLTDGSEMSCKIRISSVGSWSVTDCAVAP